MKQLITRIFFILGLIAPTLSSAGSLSPSEYSNTLNVGETITITKTLTTDPGSAVSRADVFFLADNTASMGRVISSMQTLSTDLTNGLSSRISDVGFGVGFYLGDPSERGGELTKSYQLQQPITTNPALAHSAINDWSARGGGDTPEGNFFALQQLAANGAPTIGGDSTNQDTGWRSGSSRIGVWIGDASSHELTVDQSEAISTLVDNNVTILGLNTQAAGRGIDTDGQASSIAEATGGVLVNDVDASDTDAVLNAILSSVDEATATTDLFLELGEGDTTGLDISFKCISAEGCSNVEGGESRIFEMNITALASGTYDFETIAPGIAGATEHDLITVLGDGSIPPDEPPVPSPAPVSPNPVPVPAAVWLFGSGLFGLLGMARRKS
jgi:hypothetical protein